MHLAGGTADLIEDSRLTTFQYNLKKKEGQPTEEAAELQKQESVCSESSLNRPKKSPEELLSESEQEQQDEFTSMRSFLLRPIGPYLACHI